jgi:Tol biopolymer transport system component
VYSWSRNGRFIVFQVTGQETETDIWALPLDGDRKPFPVVQVATNQFHAQLSPDDRWLAYTSQESGSRDVWVQDFPTATRRFQISTAGGVQPQWRGDSRELFYLSFDGRIMAVPIRVGTTLESGAPAELFQIHPPATPVARRYFQPTPDGQRFLVQTVADDKSITPFIVTTNWATGIQK